MEYAPDPESPQFIVARLRTVPHNAGTGVPIEAAPSATTGHLPAKCEWGSIYGQAVAAESRRLRRGISMENGLRLLAAVMSLALLAAFVGIFGWTVFRSPTGEGPANEALAYVWTTVSVLVGGVVAVAYGQPEPNKPLLVRFVPELITLVYAWAYMIVGIAAVITWLIYGEKTVLLIENAATTWLGLVVPIVSAFLKPTAGTTRA